MPRRQFDLIQQIPDLVPQGLLIPADRHDLSAPHEITHTAETTSPVEVGYILFTAGGFFYPFMQHLQLHNSRSENAKDFLDSSWMNHVGRAVVRVALDSDRYTPIHMLTVCKNEEQFARFSNVNDREFFRQFVSTWGVLRNRE